MSRAWQDRRDYGYYRTVVRPAVLLRDRGRCRIALPGTWRNRRGEPVSCRGTADCVHHTVGKGLTGWDPRYMVAACTPCNLRVGDPTRVPDPPHVMDPRWLRRGRDLSQ